MPDQRSTLMLLPLMKSRPDHRPVMPEPTTTKIATSARLVAEHPEGEEGDEERLDEDGEDDERIDDIVAEGHLGDAKDIRRAKLLTQQKRRSIILTSNQADVGVFESGLADEDAPDALPVEVGEELGDDLGAVEGVDQEGLHLVVAGDGDGIDVRAGLEVLVKVRRDAVDLDLDDREIADERFEAGGGIESDQATLVNDADAVAERIGLEHVMGGEQDGLALGLEVADDLAELASADGIETDGRLVQEKDFGVVQEGAGDVEALLHAARIALDALAAAVFQPDQLEQVGDALFGELWIDMVKTGEVA